MRPGMKMMALNRLRENGRDYPRNVYGNDYREMRDNYPRNETEYETTRNEYNGSGMNYGGVEGRFRDRRGREHYDDGRFAPMRNEMGMGYEPESRQRYRRYSDGRFAPRNEDDGEMRMGYPPTPYMPTYREGGQGMNPIGFLAHHDMGEQYRSDAGYQRMDEMEHRNSRMMPGGAAVGSMTLTKEMAERWMQGLQNADGSKGPHWTLEQVKQVLKQKGITEDPVKMWVAMNAEYSDRSEINKKHGVTSADYYADSAMAFWLKDKDAVEDKLAAYYAAVVRH